MIRIALVAAVAAFASVFAPTFAQPQGNVLILLADDLGVDMLGCYGEGSDLAPTPNLDALSAQGVRFSRVWSNPVCSPTRATILTGRYSFRTQLGTIIHPSGPDLSPLEWTIPRMLDHASPHDYRHAVIGKWHLGQNMAPATHPLELGFDHSSGPRENFGQGLTYFNWTKYVDGVPQQVTRYATSEAVDDALAWIGAGQEPWFCYVAFNAPHDPWHHPPPHLFTVDVPDIDPRGAPRAFYKAAVEALDTEIGRLLAGIDPQVRARTTVIFLGDNGTPKHVTVPPFDPTKAKLTVYEGGVGVPLIVSGVGVNGPGRECDALVNTTDLFATVLELAGISDLSAHPVPLDSVSIVPLLAQPGCPPLREFVFTEAFFPNGEGPFELLVRALRNDRYKLVRRVSGDELYDLWADPWENANLLLPSGTTLQPRPLDAYLSLSLRLETLLASQP